MTGELEVVEGPNLSVAQLVANADLIKEVLKKVMVVDVHYGTIPGTGKREKINGEWVDRGNPTLYKAGAEKLMSVFRIGMNLNVENLSSGPEIKYRVKASAFYIPTGNSLGEAYGECSSFEEKHRWKRAICDQQYFDAEPHERTEKWKPEYENYKKTGNFIKEKMVMVPGADKTNTVLKIAEKRAEVSVIRKITASSDIFYDYDESTTEAPKADNPKDVQRPQPIDKVTPAAGEKLLKSEIVDGKELFIWTGPKETKETPKAAGFRYNREKYRWETDNPDNAEKLKQYK